MADTGNARVLRFETDRFQPDAQIGSKPTLLKGDGIYNQTGAGQKASIIIDGLKTAKAHVKLENDGDTADDLRFSGPSGNRFIQLSYLDASGKNVTAQVIAGTLGIDDLGAGRATFVLIMAQGDRKYKDRGSSYRAKLTTTSETDNESDRVDCSVGKRR